MAIAGGRLTHAQLLQSQRWNTPTIHNGWEQATRQDPTRDGCNREPIHDFMPRMGSLPTARSAASARSPPGRSATSTR